LEVFEATGKKLSDWHKEHRFGETAPDSLKIGLNRDREELYDRIDRRCEEMIRNGLLEEVEGLRRRGYDLDLRPLRSIGYRHVGLYLQGKIDLERAIGLMKRDTRRLAKRQLTWLRADRAVLWFHPDRERDRMFAAIQNFYGSE
jgi:tRNA dimethylallyltransferase